MAMLWLAFVAFVGHATLVVGDSSCMEESLLADKSDENNVILQAKQEIVDDVPVIASPMPNSLLETDMLHSANSSAKWWPRKALKRIGSYHPSKIYSDYVHREKKKEEARVKKVKAKFHKCTNKCLRGNRAQAVFGKCTCECTNPYMRGIQYPRRRRRHSCSHGDRYCGSNARRRC